MPKQFQNLIGEGSGTLFQQALLRLNNSDIFYPPAVIGHEEHRFIIEQNARQIKADLSAILLEPESKNTAIAITVSALWAQMENHDYILVIPSDHAIHNIGAFHKDIAAGLDICLQNNETIYFGIKPSHPNTGYGYIHHEAGKLKNFVEKPDTSHATALIQQESLWNSGIFLIPVNRYLEHIKEIQPALLLSAQSALKHSIQDLPFLRLCKESYQKVAATSFDKIYSESLTGGSVICASFDWSDVGSWDSLLALSTQDDSNIVSRGNVVTTDTTNSYISSDGTLIAVSGMDNVVIVSTKDALLVANKDKAQDLKVLVNKLQDTKKPQACEHYIKHCPWGFYEILNQSDNTRIVRMIINPREHLVLQAHNKRSEHWVVASGSLNVTINQKNMLLTAGQSAFAEQGAHHRLENNSDIVAEVIEIQVGDISELEKDTVRFEQRVRV